MCGIAGLVTEGEHVEPATLERMCDAVHHRGPDGAGMHLDGPVALGMRRLAINDLVTGDQPFHSEDGTVTVVGNGEIYNQDDLRRQLAGRGHRFVSGSDIEVIVHLWEEYGPRCVDHLRGMFAFAVWDDRERVLFLARDRVGKKPLLYAHHGGALTFASEMRAMFLDGRIPREVDPHALDAFLACGYVPHHLCAFRHVKKLPPGHSLTWRPGERPRIERYWHLEYGPKQQLSPAEAADEVRSRLLEATKIRLMSDVPIGAFLSGGVDSSAVVAAMAMSTPDVVRTFSASFPGTTVDESVYARAVAQRYGTEHHELEIGPVDASIMPRLAWHFGEPFADPAALPSFQLAELVRRHVKVALNGDGGDETFAGYRRYHQLAMTRPADGLPHPLRAAVAVGLARAAGGTEGRAPGRRAARLARRLAMAPVRRYADLFGVFNADERRELYTPAFGAAVAGADPLAHMDTAWDARSGLGTTDRLMAVDLDTYLADDLLPKVDITSMANSIEVRSPLLDQELMAFGARLPERLKRRGTQGKMVLRDAVRPWLPDDLLDRPKQGFAVPLEGWLANELRGLPAEVLLDGTARDRGLLNPAAVERLVKDHHSRRDGALKVWTLMNLELWYRTCVDEAYVRTTDLPALA